VIDPEFLAGQASLPESPATAGFWREFAGQFVACIINELYKRALKAPAENYVATRNPWWAYDYRGIKKDPDMFDKALSSNFWHSVDGKIGIVGVSGNADPVKRYLTRPSDMAREVGVDFNRDCSEVVAMRREALERAVDLFALDAAAGIFTISGLREPVMSVAQIPEEVPFYAIKTMAWNIRRRQSRFAVLGDGGSESITYLDARIMPLGNSAEPKGISSSLADKNTSGSRGISANIRNQRKPTICINAMQPRRGPKPDKRESVVAAMIVDYGGDPDKLGLEKEEFLRSRYSVLVPGISRDTVRRARKEALPMLE
jgi:hypothetical protein